MATFDELYEMYCNGDVRLNAELDHADFGYLFAECHKNIAKYYEFLQYLEWIWEF